MTIQSSSVGDSAGCGVLGCLGGLVFGLLSGGVLLIVGALLMALTATNPAVSPRPPTAPNLRITVDEAFLNRFADQPADGTILIDVLPGNQIRLVADITIEALGVTVPVQLTGLLQLQLTGQSLQASLLNTQVSGLPLPVELNNVFEQDLVTINQDLQKMVNEVSTTLGTPVVITSLTTTDTQLQIEVQELP